jgi:drug/metabolite transporter (DMT)-like permease
MTSRRERRSRWLLAVLVLIWGVSWPVIKVGVAAAPPIWFARLRYACHSILNPRFREVLSEGAGRNVLATSQSGV